MIVQNRSREFTIFGTEQVSDKCPVFSHVKIDSFQKIANQYYVRNLGTRNIILILIILIILILIKIQSAQYGIIREK